MLQSADKIDMVMTQVVKIFNQLFAVVLLAVDLEVYRTHSMTGIYVTSQAIYSCFNWKKKRSLYIT